MFKINPYRPGAGVRPQYLAGRDEDIENVSYRLQDDILNNGSIITNLKEILEEERVEDLESIIKLIDIDNMAINVFMPKENQKEQ